MFALRIKPNRISPEPLLIVSGDTMPASSNQTVKQISLCCSLHLIPQNCSQRERIWIIRTKFLTVGLLQQQSRSHSARMFHLWRHSSTGSGANTAGLCGMRAKWIAGYEPPVSFAGLARTYRATVHHSSPIAVKRDILQRYLYRIAPAQPAVFQPFRSGLSPGVWYCLSGKAH